MFITLQSVKRNLGLFNLQIEDLVLGVMFILLFIIFFLLHLYTFSFFLISVGLISLIPTDFSKCSRTYKLFLLFSRFLFRDKNYYYIKERNED